MKNGKLLLALSLCGCAVILQAFDAAKTSWHCSDPDVKLFQNPDGIQADFSFSKFIPTQQGNFLYNRHTADILLDKPLNLGQEVRRILFEARGHIFGSWNTRNNMVQLWPMVQDKSGEIFCYIPAKFPHIYQGGTGWAAWMTPIFNCGEAGGVQHDICTCEGGDKNNWPDTPLKFLGFRLIVHTSKPEEAKSGNVVISTVTPSPVKISRKRTYFYADSVCKKPGEYTLISSISTEFQGMPVVETETKIKVEAGKKQIIELPIPDGDGYFWGTWQLSDSSGKQVACSTFRHQNYDNGFACKAKVLPYNTVPKMGYLRVNPKRSGVYETKENPVIEILAFPKNQKKLSVQCDLMNYRYNDVYSSKTFEVDSAKGKMQVLLYKPQLLSGRDAYKVRFTVKNEKGQILQSYDYIFGRKTDVKAAYKGRTGAPVNRHALKDKSYNRASFIVISYQQPKTEKDLLKKFLFSINQSGNMTRNWTHALDISGMEILPGVYDFAALDQMLDSAADRGIMLTLRIGHIEQELPYRWLKYTEQHNFDGLPLFEHYYGSYSLADKEYLEAWYRLNRILFDRYGNHPAFQGYYLMQPAGEFTVSDKPYEGIIAGYEPPMREGFREFLQNDLNLDLQSLNKRWGTNYKKWSEVMPPLPAFEMGKMPDLRMCWTDWSAYKQKLSKALFFPEAVRRIREYTDRHVIIIYGGMQEMWDKVDYFHNGGNHFEQGEESLVEPWMKGRCGWISEPHHPQRWAAYGDPADKGWVLDWTLYLALRQAWGGGMNLHLYYDPRQSENSKLFGGEFAYDRVRRYFPILDELNGFEATTPRAQAGILHDPNTLESKHRTVFWPRLADLCRAFELFKQTGIPLVNVSKYNIKNLNLIVLNPIDEVMSSENINMVADRVKEGACVILCANTGKYSIETGNKPWQLLNALGITPPKSAYCEKGETVSAKIVKDNPLFSEPVNFYTTASFVRDLHGPEIQAAFWKYPYRWIPVTDYFGYYPNCEPGGEILARFRDGGAALSIHHVGKGKALVFWGTPDWRPEVAKDFAKKAIAWAGITDPSTTNPIHRMLEGKHRSNGRYYAAIYNETPGTWKQRMFTIPDGNWFVEELVGDRKIGIISGKTLREKGLDLIYLPGSSPLQILRFSPMKGKNNGWRSTKYPVIK